MSTPTVLLAPLRRGLLLPLGYRAGRKSRTVLRRKVFRGRQALYDQTRGTPACVYADVGTGPVGVDLDVDMP